MTMAIGQAIWVALHVSSLEVNSDEARLCASIGGDVASELSGVLAKARADKGQ